MFSKIYSQAASLSKALTRQLTSKNSPKTSSPPSKEETRIDYNLDLANSVSLSEQSPGMMELPSFMSSETPTPISANAHCSSEIEAFLLKGGIHSRETRLLVLFLLQRPHSLRSPLKLLSLHLLRR